MSPQPADIIRTAAMSRPQYRALAIVMLALAADGYDALSIAVAAPGIVAAWGIDSGTLGILLAVEVIGAAIGAPLFGWLADLVGRRIVLLACLAILSVGMAMSALSPDLMTLMLFRFLTGLGIGGVNPAVMSVASEVANERMRDRAVTLLGFGLLLGSIVGGLAAAAILAFFSWRWLFGFGCIITSITFALAYFWVPETIEFLARRRPKGFLKRINATLALFGHGEVTNLPMLEQVRTRARYRELFSADQRRNTVFITLACVFQLAAFSFVGRWLPKLAVDAGHSSAAAASILTVASVGGLVGAVAVGSLAQRFGLSRVTIGMLILSFAGISLTGPALGNFSILMMIVGITGFATNGSIAGFFAIMARGYPSGLRSTGMGFTLGFGRGGAAFSPIVIGILFSGGVAVSAVAFMAGALAVIAAILISFSRTTH